MTQKYIYVRREIYEKNPASKLSHTRNFADMVRLFKYLYWVMLILIAGSIIATIVFLILNPSNPYLLVPMGLIIIIAIVSQLPREKHLYHESARKKELEYLQEGYQQYISEILQILKKYDIDSVEKVSQLKHECEDALKSQKEKYSTIGNKIFDMLIGVPLGALIASMIYSGLNVVLTSVFSVIFIGIAIAGLNKVVQAVFFYTEGYFKDKYLLDVLNELNYSSVPNQLIDNSLVV